MSAQDRGWGTGWPSCQTDKIVPLIVYETAFPGGIREELRDLVVMLIMECYRKGFRFMSPGCWGFGCRPIKRSDGTLTNTPSNHSWGLAIDINAPRNVFGGAKASAELAKEENRHVVRLFKRYGFQWGGDYTFTKDWMHFEFMGTLRAARRFTAEARQEFLDADYMVEGTRYERLRQAMDALRAKVKASTVGTVLTIKTVRGLEEP